MTQSSDTGPVSAAKIRHDFANDINSLKMNLEALDMAQDDPEQHAALVRLMHDTIDGLHQRLNTVVQRLTGEGEQPAA